jgi:Rho-binding antiterminator
MLSCEQYDYIEIACMHRYPVQLVLRSGQEISGTAVDTARNDQKQECVKLLVENENTLVVLDEVLEMMALAENPHFERVRF